MSAGVACAHALRVSRGNVNEIAREFERARNAPDVIRRVFIVTSSLSRGAVRRAGGRYGRPYARSILRPAVLAAVIVLFGMYRDERSWLRGLPRVIRKYEPAACVLNGEIFHNGHYTTGDQASIGSMLRPCRPKIESAIMMMKSAEDRHLMRALRSARPSVKMILVVFENLARIGQSSPDARFC